MSGRWAMEVNVCSLYDEKKGENFFYYLFTHQGFGSSNVLFAILNDMQLILSSFTLEDCTAKSNRHVFALGNVIISCRSVP